MTYAPAVPRLLLLLTALALALTGTACGSGDDDGDKASDQPSRSATSSTDPAGSDEQSSGGLTVTDGITPDDLVSCLTGAGLAAAATDATMLGVDDPHVEVHVDPFEGYEGPTSQQADLYVFADPASAQKNAPYITLGGSDDPDDRRFKVGGNVVLTFYVITAGEPSSDEAAVMGCLPS